MSKANEDTTQYHSQNSKKCLKRRNLWCLDNKVDPFTLIARVFELPDKIPRCHFWWKFGSLNNQPKKRGSFLHLRNWICYCRWNMRTICGCYFYSTTTTTIVITPDKSLMKTNLVPSTTKNPKLTFYPFLLLCVRWFKKINSLNSFWRI